MNEVDPKDTTGRFSLIFKTSQGSTYHIAENGRSYRFKKNGERVVPQSPNEAIFFLSEEEFNRLAEMTLGFLHLDPLVNQKILTTECAIGTHPLELNSADSEEKIVYEKGDDYLILKGTQIGDLYRSGTLFGSIHFGHSIIEIAK